MWTLVSPSILKMQGAKYILPFVEANKYNEMSLLGDLSVATTPPLVLRLVADTLKPRRIESDGTVGFTIAGLEFYCNNKQITDSFEKSLAFYFMLYGRWSVSEGEAEIVDEQLVAVRYTAEPEETDPEQGFDFLGSMSEMISKNFNRLTAPDGSIERLSPKSENIFLGLMIPNDYKSEILPLWRFILNQPKNDSVSAK